MGKGVTPSPWCVQRRRARNEQSNCAKADQFPPCLLVGVGRQLLAIDSRWLPQPRQLLQWQQVPEECVQCAVPRYHTQALDGRESTGTCMPLGVGRCLRLHAHRIHVYVRGHRCRSCREAARRWICCSCARCQCQCRAGHPCVTVQADHSSACAAAAATWSNGAVLQRVWGRVCTMGWPIPSCAGVSWHIPFNEL